MKHPIGINRSLAVRGIGSWARWAVRKLASQDPSYLFRRLSYLVRKAAIDRTFPVPWQRRRARLSVDIGDDEGSGLRKYFLERQQPSWHFDSESSGLVAAIPRSTRERTLAAAGEILQRRFSLVGYQVVTLDPIDWSHAPLGDVIWTRDLNRHACLEQLGFAYRYTNDEVYARALVKLSESWIEQCSSRIGQLPWDTPFQVGRRVNSWIWVFHLLLPSSEWNEAARRRFLVTLGLLAEYLFQTLEYHSPGNHILLEAKALALCGEVFPELDGAKGWRRKGWGTLELEIDRQICSDGVHEERATMYHRIVAGELAELWLFCRRNCLPQAWRLEDVVRRMAEFQRWIHLGDGRYPLFGDSRSDDTYYRFSAPAVVDFVDQGVPACVEEGVSDHTWWAAWPSRSDKPTGGEATGEAMNEELSKAFLEGGYYISRSSSSRGPSVFVWDCGPLGYAANRKHAHADALSFVLAVDGEPLLVDLGIAGPRTLDRHEAPSSSYAAVDQRRDLRTTRAHNTLTVDGEDQAELGKRNEIWDPPQVSMAVWGQSPEFDVMLGRHDGYLRLSEPVVHERFVSISRGGGYWLVLERVTGFGLHTVDLRYHVAAGGKVELLADEEVQVTKGDSRLRLAFLVPRGGDSRFSISIEERLGELREGSPEHHAVIRGTLASRTPILIATLISLPEMDARARFIEADSSSCLVEVWTPVGLDLIRMEGIKEIAGTGVVLGDIACTPIVIQRSSEGGEIIGTWRFNGGDLVQTVSQEETP